MESSQDPHLSSANAAAAQQLDHQLPEEKGQQEDSKDVGDRPPFQQKVDLESQSDPSREDTTDDTAATRNDPIRVRFVRHLQAEIDTNKVGGTISRPSPLRRWPIIGASDAQGNGTREARQTDQWLTRCPRTFSLLPPILFQVTLPMLGFCLMTGWTDAVSFAAAFIFSGFQT